MKFSKQILDDDARAFLLKTKTVASSNELFVQEYCKVNNVPKHFEKIISDQVMQYFENIFTSHKDVEGYFKNILRKYYFDGGFSDEIINNYLRMIKLDWTLDKETKEELNALNDEFPYNEPINDIAYDEFIWEEDTYLTDPDDDVNTFFYLDNYDYANDDFFENYYLRNYRNTTYISENKLRKCNFIDDINEELTLKMVDNLNDLSPFATDEEIVKYLYYNDEWYDSTNNTWYSTKIEDIREYINTDEKINDFRLDVLNNIFDAS